MPPARLVLRGRDTNAIRSLNCQQMDVPDAAVKEMPMKGMELRAVVGLDFDNREGKLLQ